MEKGNIKQFALIYCRVSSDRQVKEGHGLESQEQRCKNYAKMMGYTVEKVFREEGIKGELFDRPEMLSLIDHLECNINKKYIIIFDDLKRFSRDVVVHFKLKSEIYGRGSTVESPNFKFEETPEGKFVETIIVATGELEKNQNKRQVKQKMRARLESGFWPFCMPLGLKNKIDPVKGRVLHPDDPYATIYKEAIEKYERRELLILEDVRNFILEKYKELGICKKISISGTKNILTKLLYAGYIEYKPWGIDKKKGQHEGFISIETYDNVQAILQGKAKPRLRKDYNDDFPLRPYILCKHCNVALTGSWNKGRTNRYPNYWCKNPKCLYAYKAINKHKIEGEFEKLLSTIKPSQGILELTKSLFIDIWHESKQGHILQMKLKQDEIKIIDSKIASFLDKVAKTSIPEVIKLYEDELVKLQEAKRKLLQQDNNDLFTEKDLGTALDMVISILEKPDVIWKNEGIEWKRNILFMYFEENLAYDYNLGFGTASLALPIRLINEFSPSKNQLVEMPRIELGSEKTLL